MVIQTDTLKARILGSITALVQQPFKELKETVEKKEQAVQKWANLTEALGTTTFCLPRSTNTNPRSLIQTTEDKQKACSTELTRRLKG